MPVSAASVKRNLGGPSLEAGLLRVTARADRDRKTAATNLRRLTRTVSQEISKLPATVKRQGIGARSSMQMIDDTTEVINTSLDFLSRLRGVDAESELTTALDEYIAVMQHKRAALMKVCAAAVTEESKVTSSVASFALAQMRVLPTRNSTSIRTLRNRKTPGTPGATLPTLFTAPRSGASSASASRGGSRVLRGFAGSIANQNFGFGPISASANTQAATDRAMLSMMRQTVRRDAEYQEWQKEFWTRFERNIGGAGGGAFGGRSARNRTSSPDSGIGGLLPGALAGLGGLAGGRLLGRAASRATRLGGRVLGGIARAGLGRMGLVGAGALAAGGAVQNAVAARTARAASAAAHVPTVAPRVASTAGRASGAAGGAAKMLGRAGMFVGPVIDGAMGAMQVEGNQGMVPGSATTRDRVTGGITGALTMGDLASTLMGLFTGAEQGPGSMQRAITSQMDEARNPEQVQAARNIARRLLAGESVSARDLGPDTAFHNMIGREVLNLADQQSRRGAGASADGSGPDAGALPEALRWAAEHGGRQFLRRDGNASSFSAIMQGTAQSALASLAEQNAAIRGGNMEGSARAAVPSDAGTLQQGYQGALAAGQVSNTPVVPQATVANIERARAAGGFTPESAWAAVVGNTSSPNQRRTALEWMVANNVAPVDASNPYYVQTMARLRASSGWTGAPTPTGTGGAGGNRTRGVRVGGSTTEPALGIAGSVVEARELAIELNPAAAREFGEAFGEALGANARPSDYAPFTGGVGGGGGIPGGGATSGGGGGTTGPRPGGGGPRPGSGDLAAAAAMAVPAGLGGLSRRYESGGNPGAIGHDSTGGFSYGSYQIAAGAGTMGPFLRYLRETNPEMAARLDAAGGEAGARAGSPAFRQAFQELARDPAFNQAQNGFIRRTHYDPVVARADALGLGVGNRSAAVQDVLWSTGVQHGGNTNVIERALARSGQSAATISDDDLIRNIYAERRTRFGSSTPGVQASVMRRFDQEQAQALAMRQAGAQPGATPAGADGVRRLDASSVTRRDNYGDAVAADPAARAAFTGLGVAVPNSGVAGADGVRIPFVPPAAPQQQAAAPAAPNAPTTRGGGPAGTQTPAPSSIPLVLDDNNMLLVNLPNII